MTLLVPPCHGAQPGLQPLDDMVATLSVALGPLLGGEVPVSLQPAPSWPSAPSLLPGNNVGHRRQRLGVQPVDMSRQPLPGASVVTRPVAGINPAPQALLDE
ncbi:hypothetical protein D3C78_1609760 [compost metagenome]